MYIYSQTKIISKKQRYRIYDQLEPIYYSSVPIQHVVLKTYRERWTIETGNERGSGRSVLAARHDDDVW